MITRKTTPEDSLLLGRTQEQGGSELQAGFRADFIPSPVTQALSTMRGRMIARTMSFMVSAPGARHFIASRIPMIKQAIIQSIPPDVPHPLIVNTAAGYSPLGIWLAEALPHAEVVEIDLPEVMTRRQMRLKKAGITLPANLKSITADLGTIPLLDVLDGRNPHVIDWTGAYSPPDEMIRLTDYFRSILHEDGACVIYIPWQKGVDAVRAGTRFFKNQVGDTPGIVSTQAEIVDRLTQAGYSHVEVLMPSEFAPRIGLADEVLDIEVLAVARR